jgi:hypothetical protein
VPITDNYPRKQDNKSFACSIRHGDPFFVRLKSGNATRRNYLGVSNIITLVNNIGKKPIVVKDDGRGIKNINQFYQKEKARLQSIYDRQGMQDGSKMK